MCFFPNLYQINYKNIKEKTGIMLFHAINYPTSFLFMQGDISSNEIEKLRYCNISNPTLKMKFTYIRFFITDVCGVKNKKIDR